MRVVRVLLRFAVAPFLLRLLLATTSSLFPLLTLLLRLLGLRTGLLLLLRGRTWLLLLLLAIGRVGTLTFYRGEFVGTVIDGSTMAFVLLDYCHSDSSKRQGICKVSALKE